MERIGLSGIFIFDTFEGEDSRHPTCIEDCREETRKRWLKSLKREALDNTLSHIFNTYKEISKALTDEEMVDLIDVMCRQLHGDAIYYSIRPLKKEE